ncbi:MAG TPA: hypothetical protein VJ773_04800 [Gemmatimonadales bacterium]|nr:hypothetical protein [Gemmatimonadales bacterium]
MPRFTSRDLMVSVLPGSAAGEWADCATACTNEPTRADDCATACTNEPTRSDDCVTACTNEPTRDEAWSDRARDGDLAILQGDLARALA